MLQRLSKGADALTATDVMKMGTVNGAKLLNFEKVGKIKEGWAADIAMFNTNKLEYCGSHSDPLASIIFCGYNHGAEYTIVNGKVVVDKGELTGFDEKEIIQNANRIAEKMLK